ncbi:hypothetical protein [Ideonella sp.]|uniref:hypothetical protein n=1 Tax=Ideonella sp. TaxID=1929293 RepID=UPI003BB6BCCD
MHRSTLITATLLACSLHAGAQDRADMEATSIIGNRELPKVLYIVPWKKTTPPALGGKPALSLVDEVLAPLDRDVFRRQVAAAAALAPATPVSAAASAPASSTPTVP